MDTKYFMPIQETLGEAEKLVTLLWQKRDPEMRHHINLGKKSVCMVAYKLRSTALHPYAPFPNHPELLVSRISIV